jgi:hypothetical protein
LLTKGLFAVDVPFGSMSFDITKPMKINLRGLFIEQKAVLQNVLSCNNLLNKAKDFSSSIRVGQLS